MAFKLPASAWPARLFGLAMIVAGIAGWFYNRHLAATAGEFYIRLCIFTPLGIFGGLLMLLRPEWSGPLRKDSPRAQKTTVWTIVALMVVVSGADFYWLSSSPGPRRLQAAPRIHWTADMGTPK
jgi:hypothetical protein